MDQNYTIYFRNKPIYLGLEKDGLPTLERPFKIKDLLHDIKEDKYPEGIIIRNSDPSLELEKWKEDLKVVPAGGGLVENSKGEYLVIFRRGVWDLPKGKQEEDEEIEITALREVTEETGVSPIRLGKSIGCTWHIIKDDGEYCLKETHWYHMHYGNNDSETLKPQTEEDIEEVRWVDAYTLNLLVKGSYPSVKWVCQQID